MVDVVMVYSGLRSAGNSSDLREQYVQAFSLKLLMLEFNLD